MTAEPSHKEHQRYIYQLPTRLDVEDQLIILGPFSLTLRQSFVLTVAACIVANVWRSCAWLMMWSEIGLLIRFGMAALPLLLGLFWAFIHLSDRYLEEWVLIVGRYLLLTKQSRWQSINQQEDPYRLKMARQQQKSNHSIDEEENIL